MNRDRLRLEGLDLDYARGGRQVLAGVNVQAEPGEVLAVTGPSGSGKSSLLTLLAGLESPDAGRVLLGGIDVRELGGSALRQRYGLVLQGHGVISVLSAAENVELVLQARGLPRAEVRERAAAALAAVDMTDFADHLTEQLSGGQQQRVAVARALVTEPDVVLADEPTGQLDHASREKVLDELFEIADRGAVVVIATHDRTVADECDRELALADGQVVEAPPRPVRTTR